MAGEEKKAKAAATETPSAQALGEVGEPKANAPDEEKNAHAARYAAAKRKHRWG
jgi:hypothetical protein